MLHITKAITYDPVTKDFLLELDNQPVGYAATTAQAELILDQLVFERLRRCQVATLTPEEKVAHLVGLITDERED